MSYEDAISIHNDNIDNPDWKEARKINRATYQKANRMKQRIEKMMQIGNCIFLTLTFNENIINSTSENTRRKYVQEFLKSESDYYIANVDFGEENGREHYHCIVVTDKIDCADWKKYGGRFFEKVKKTKLSAIRISKYLTKLTNRYISHNRKRTASIYSRAVQALAKESLFLYANSLENTNNVTINENNDELTYEENTHTIIIAFIKNKLSKNIIFLIRYTLESLIKFKKYIFLEFRRT